jgi:hypothetical protein
VGGEDRFLGLSSIYFVFYERRGEQAGLDRGAEKTDFLSSI